MIHAVCTLAMSLIQIKVIYNYYSSKRVTPVYIEEENLLKFSFGDLKNRLINEVPHLTKATSLRWTVEDDGLEVDLSQTYFNLQIRGLLEKSKTICINAIDFESPAPCTLSRKEGNIHNTKPKDSKAGSKTGARRTLALEQDWTLMWTTKSK